MTLQGIGMTAGGAFAEWAPPFAVICGGGVLGTLSVLAVIRTVHRTRLPLPAPVPTPSP
jgi:hypothetical protein